MMRLLGLVLGGVMAVGAADAAEVNVYSARKDHLLKPVLDQFTAKTGIKVNLLSAGEEQLLERLKSEGQGSPADLFITTDVAHLHKARVAGVLQPTHSAEMDKNIPARYRDPQGYWYGLSARARVVLYAKDRVKPSELSTYEDLADPKWKGRICVRSSSSTYNQSLLAGLVAVMGPDKAESWAKSMVGNMARKPQGGDRDQIAAVAAGQCDLAIANTYYFGGMQASSKAEEKDAAAKVGIFFPNQQGRGAHMNVAGAGVTASAKHKAEAVKLLEFLSGPEAQKTFAEANNEFPVLASAQASPIVAAWGPFKAEDINVAMLGENNPQAVRIFDRVGWR
ncbi:Iron(III) ABC transporter, periplasmic iron(III)-binding protein [Magnetospirillum sp. XM-1]|uniref:Fe(3+) ABC transporter substrate-binding protein n=1 Tax=Magnetospirillum sp. XM-1 TaxID=1663591 RepID=UPI00073DEC93|nr:Fe(3+) ABC transporter substrate-binding protein [Magnetospirillum sp. XM-1]CUW38441.1 Iron(III) ABC transporter, periplasmic iron(III)-binding protein [Magnetospirillum sp. XM-1]